MGSSGRAGGPGMLSRLLLQLGMLAAGLSYSSWWVSHTILDTSRTQRVTHAVLSDADFRSFVAKEISPTVTAAVPMTTLDQALAAAGIGSSATTTPGAVTTTVPAAQVDTATQLDDRLAAVLGQPAVETQLEDFVVNLHKGVLGQATTPATISQATLTELVTAAVPGLPASALTSLHPITVNPPRLGILSTTRTFLQDKFGLLVAIAAVLLFAGIILSRNRQAAIAMIGRWLIGISLVHLLVLWLIPVVIVPAVSSSPWAALVSGVAKALSGGLVAGLVVMFVAGIVLMVGARFVGNPNDLGADPTAARPAKA